MIAVLQRQHVAKRAIPPVRQRARNMGVRWQRSEISVPVGAGPRARPARKIPRRLRKRPAARSSLAAPLGRARAERVELSARLARQKPVRKAHGARPGKEAGHPRPVHSIARAARRGLLPAVLGLVLLALVLVPIIRGVKIRLPGSRPLLPSGSDLADVLYRTVVPAELPGQANGARPVSVMGLQTVSYRTRSGDSLSQIAQRARLTLGTVISWNDIRDARSLPAGTLLELPNGDGLKYRVRRGDTLEGIARSSGVPLNDILDWNRLASSVIPVGQVLFLPGARMSQGEINRITGSLFISPMRGRLSSTFGSRSDPFTGVVRFHNGIDLVARLGTAVSAAMAGSVAAVGFNANYGRYIFLQHPGYQTMYAHLNRITVSTGQKVAQGQKIGELGNTGYSTGPHLHFSIYRGSEPVDPLRFLK